MVMAANVGRVSLNWLTLRTTKSKRKLINESFCYILQDGFFFCRVDSTIVPLG